MSAPQFLNVDLEIESAHDLSPVVTALEATGEVFCLHVRPTEAGYLGVFELVRDVRTPDLAVRNLVEAVRSLPASARRLVKRGTRLDLSVGMRAGTDSKPLELSLSPTALRSAATIGARITMCVYPPATSDETDARPGAAEDSVVPRRG